MRIDVVIAGGGQWCDGGEAETALGQGADQQQLPQLAFAVHGVAAISTGSINESFGGIEADGAWGEVFPQLVAGLCEQLIEAVAGGMRIHPLIMCTCSATVNE